MHGPALLKESKPRLTSSRPLFPPTLTSKDELSSSSPWVRAPATSRHRTSLPGIWVALAAGGYVFLVYLLLASFADAPLP